MKKIILIVALLLPFFATAQKLASYRNMVNDGYNFWVYTPADYDSTKADKPIVLFLHGNSLCGNDLNRVRRYGTLDALGMGRQVDAVVVAPQNPGGSWQPTKIMNVVQWVEERFSVDTNRLYVIGMSLGGYGTIHFTAAYPDKVAAAIELCGGSNLKDHCSLCQVPLWIMHGTADRAISLSESQKIVNAMAACGDTSRLIFTKLPGQSHGALAKVFYLEEAYEWLFSHNLQDPGRPVNRDVVINVSTFSKAYTNIDRSTSHFTVVNGATGQVEPTTTATTDNTSKTSTTSVKYHTVKKGDTLSAIARKYHTTVSKICKLNKIKETTILQIGRKLRVR
ncbi:MAG: LysM peptidoglycan-binding domain-containing protein [Bacteroidales bacterium]|nr:LysM peptidoglycan-binding domain-containing protein [Bacteroidales bacterium]MCR5115827.1 LysM peptidoglycan-binding domain-containing protein [Bacteroidales bacterium]